MSNKIFYLRVLVFLLLGYVWQYLFGYFLGLALGGVYSSCIINIIMSVLFIKMFYDRKGDHGQNLWIGVTKAIGTLAAAVLIGCFGINRLGGVYPDLGLLGILIFIIDGYYCYLLYGAWQKRVQLKKVKE
ncbi:hypothetical protein ACG2LH_01780 [Zhouia sp. PK063]